MTLAHLALEALGFDTSEFDVLLEEVRDNGAPRDTFFSSLYDDGQRDSRFTVDVYFPAYIDASR